MNPLKKTLGPVDGLADEHSEAEAEPFEHSLRALCAQSSTAAEKRAAAASNEILEHPARLIRQNYGSQRFLPH